MCCNGLQSFVAVTPHRKDALEAIATNRAVRVQCQRELREAPMLLERILRSFQIWEYRDKANSSQVYIACIAPPLLQTVTSKPPLFTGSRL
jgi:hypothetical protein